MPRITSFPARLHVLLAHDKKYGVVLRKGPSNQVCLVRLGPRKERIEWVDARLVWALDGCLYAAEVTSEERIGEQELIRDFNPYTFEKRAAPY